MSDFVVPEFHPQFSRYLADEFQHEAGYDAYLTAAVLANMWTKITSDREQLATVAQEVGKDVAELEGAMRDRTGRADISGIPLEVMNKVCVDGWEVILYSPR